MTTRLQFQRGTDSVTHGGQGWIVSNTSWQCDLPDDVAAFMLADGRSGCSLVEEPEGDGEAVHCPHCGYAWRLERKE